MKLLRGGLSPIAAFAKGSVASIGNFDGVHLGHQALLKTLKKQAIERQLPLVVLLFEPQPNEFFKGAQAPARLSSLREKLARLSLSQVDYVCCLRFNKMLAEMSAEHFAEKYIFSLLQARYLLIGADFRFGRERQGDLDLLKNLARNCQIDTFPDFLATNQRVSSTNIRKALAQGDLNLASMLLGRTYSLCGRVVAGNGLAASWGIPTANIAIAQRKVPMAGVFCVQVRISNQGPWLNGVANLGRRPTVDGSKNVLEIHLFDYNASLYGSMLQVNFLQKLRDEIKFESMGALIEQIHKDVALAKDTLPK